MNSNLLSKFIIIYIFIIIIGFGSISSISYGINNRNLTENTVDSMSKEAYDIAKRYTDSDFTKENLKSIKVALSTISILSNTRIMFITPEGDILLDTGSDIILDNTYLLKDFDSTLTGSKYYQTGLFYGFFGETNISVMAPITITNSFTMKGYVAIHIPVSKINDTVYTTFDSNYVTFTIMLALSALFIILYLVQVHIPLKEIIKGANQYSKGNLSYQIKSLNHDEIGRLGISLNYMASELSEMDKFQQKFLSNISHDFRSPLTSIKGYLEAIQDGTIPPEMINKYINIVLFETERLTKLTSNILTLNELDPKSIRLNISVFDINGVIKHILETFEGTCKDKKISFKLTFSSKSLNVVADIDKIQQVVYNLIDNAVKFSVPNSTVRISTTEKGEKAFISIKDNGCGIPKKNMDKIWNRFFKSDVSRGKDKKGSGLGLSIIKEIILSHNENIDVISTEGVGTEFIFTLPRLKL